MPLPYETLNQVAGLALTLVGGWFLGLASAPGGRKWRALLRDAELENAAYRDLAETERRALEREVAELRSTSASATPAAGPPESAGWRGWFGWGRDNLARIRGIDAAREERLNALGIKTYREIEKMSGDDEAALEQRLGVEAGTIAAGEWRAQAAMLRAGNEEEHARRFA